MTIEVPIPDVGDVPLWAWLTAGGVAWYAVAGVVIRRRVLPDEVVVPVGAGEPDAITRGLLWIFSPVVVAAAAVCVPFWPLSGGIVRPPWRWFKS